MTVYAKHLNAHIPVLKGMDKLLKNLDSKIGQSDLGNFVGGPRAQAKPSAPMKEKKPEQEDHYVTF